MTSLIDPLDPRFLYLTPRQAELWREVFRRQSPLHRDPDFARIYHRAFEWMAERTNGAVHLIGLGCGTGVKERELCSRLPGPVIFSALDASADLVAEASRTLTAAGAQRGISQVGDLGEAGGGWLDGVAFAGPRLFTFFGLVPNFAPDELAKIFRAMLRPGDWLLASAHLVPVARGGVTGGMKTILPQYDNAETRAWLAEAVRELGWEERLEAPVLQIGELHGVPSIIGSARWKEDATFSHRGEPLTVTRAVPLRLFFSLRYTPAGFEDMLSAQGFRAERLAVTTSGEEGVWAVQA